MSILEDRKKRSEEILQGKFIRRVLNETAKEIDKSQSRTMSGFRSTFWNNRRFNISSNQLSLQHDKRIRFLDMKNRIRRDGTSQRKKSRVVHNRIIYGKYNNLVRELSFGYTDAVKEELRSLED